MKEYKNLLSKIEKEGIYKSSGRENMPGTFSAFGEQFKWDLSKGFPLLTTKKLSFKNIVVELLWFLKGDSNIKYLIDNGCNIWNEDVYNYYSKKCNQFKIIPMDYDLFVECIKEGDKSYIEYISNYKLGDTGKQYPCLWRSWGDDQIQKVYESLKNNPDSRRHIVSAWNPETLDEMALPACHTLFQFYVANGKLSLQLYQRSADLFLGVPFNIASYALLIHIFCELLDLQPGKLIITFGDLHLYENHVEQAAVQIDREERKLPKLAFSDVFKEDALKVRNETLSLDTFWATLIPEDFKIENYNPHPAIKAKLSTGI